jgi:hypothetical protein
MLLASRYGTISSVGEAQIAAIVSDYQGAAYTYDGSTWTYVAYSNAITTNALTYVYGAMGPDGVAFLGNATDNTRTSTDFVTTYNELDSIVGTNFASTSGGNGAYYYNGTWALGSAVSIINFDSRLSYSTDLTTWTADNPLQNGGSNDYVYVVFHDGTQWLVGGANSSGQRLQKKTTLGSGSWTGITTAWTNTWDIAFDGTTYMIATSTANVYTSTDLVTFTARAPGATSRACAYGNGRFVVMSGTTAYYSTDSGVTWNTGGSVTTAYAIKFSPTLGKFVVGGSSGDVYTSDDAVTWSTSNIGTANRVTGVATQ